ncbi:hypothetical protein AHAS_Ahas19G0202100 [Arachis hypogaea]
MEGKAPGRPSSPSPSPSGRGGRLLPSSPPIPPRPPPSPLRESLPPNPNRRCCQKNEPGRRRTRSVLAPSCSAAAAAVDWGHTVTVAPWSENAVEQNVRRERSCVFRCRRRCRNQDKFTGKPMSLFNTPALPSLFADGTIIGDSVDDNKELLELLLLLVWFESVAATN